MISEENPVIERLYTAYQANGYISEEFIFDVIEESSLSLNEIDWVMEQLLLRGVIVDNDPSEEDDEEFRDRSRVGYDEIYEKAIAIDPSLRTFIDEVRKIRPPQTREWQRLMPQAKSGNMYARERIISMYMRVAIKTAYYYHTKYGIPLADSIQETLVGLVIAFDRYEIGRQDNFSTYAPWWMTQVLRRNVAIAQSGIYVPVHAREPLYKIIEIFNSLDGYVDFNTEDSELLSAICSELDCSREDAIRHLRLLVPAQSLETMKERDATLPDYYAYEMPFESDAENTLLIERVSELLDSLRAREKEVIQMRYGFGDGKEKTLEAVGQSFGVTRERIRQIEMKALKKLGHPTQRKRLIDFY